MKRVFVGLMMMLALSGFVFAASSEISTEFVVDSPSREVAAYVPSGSFVGDYLGYIVLVLVILIFVYFVLKGKKAPVKRKVSKKKVSRKKVSTPTRQSVPLKGKKKVSKKKK